MRRFNKMRIVIKIIERYTDKMTNDIIASDKIASDKMTNGQNA